MHLFDAERLLDDLPGQVVKPWPVSTAAQSTVAIPSWTFTVAVETSSAPSAPSMWTMPRA